MQSGIFYVFIIVFYLVLLPCGTFDYSFII